MANHRRRTIDLLLLMTPARLDISHIQLYINSVHNILFRKKKVYYVNNLVQCIAIKFQEKKNYLTH